jgi:AcrR family transcriptional regulator
VSGEPAPGAGSAAPFGTRADAQRDRILCAALRCFVDHGFHAASMASIAEAAQMSAGLIYRYFENKHAIVLAIVERQLEEKRALIRQLHASDHFAADLLQAFEEWCTQRATPMSVALMLEMAAESTRNPQIAEALRASDEQTRREFQRWLVRSPEDGGMGYTEDEAARRALEMRLIVDGLAMRAAREPGIDRDMLRAAVTRLVDVALRPAASG